MRHVPIFRTTARRFPARRSVAAAAAVLAAAMLFTACGGRDPAPTSTQTPASTRPSETATVGATVAQRTATPVRSDDAPALAEALPTPTAVTTPTATATATAVTPAPPAGPAPTPPDATPTAGPPPIAAPPTATVAAAPPTSTAAVVQESRTPPVAPSTQTRWVRDRVAAVERVWGFTDAGEVWMEGYDMRQMVAQPSWYGSYGYKSWAGAGQAVPRLVLHELSHSYWGAFDVPGLPGISWDATDDGPSPGISAFRSDLETFMAQPPDRFEPLRDRFRNLPNLVVGEYPDLFHFSEADMIYMTGGDLDLVPPALRRYFSGFLDATGVGGVDFDAWSDALHWFLGMSDTDRRAAGEVFGLQHLPLAKYERLTPAESTDLPAVLVDTLNAEEEQRLRDFAEQFDDVKEKEFGLVDAAGIDRGFQFWRDYIREMSGLHERHSGILRESGAGIGVELAAALDFYRAIQSRDTAEQAVRTREQFHDRPVFRDLAVLLDPRALIRVFAETAPGSGDGLGTVFIGYASQLARLVQAADDVIDSGRQDPAEGAQAFEAFVAGLDDDGLRSSINVVIDMMRESDAETTRESLRRVDNATILRLLAVRPEVARSNDVTPNRLLQALGITTDADIDTLTVGVRTLLENSSGNFEIDRGADELMYALLDIREVIEPGSTLTIFDGARVRLGPWLDANPIAALTALNGDVPRAAQLIVSTAGVRATAPGMLHGVISTDPLLAANLLLEMESAGVANIVPDTLNHLVYDAYWREMGAEYAVGAISVAVFLSQLAQSRGNDWLREQILLGAEQYRAAIDAGELEEEYPQRHADTLEAISIAPLSDSIRGVLAEVMTSLPNP